LDQICYAHTIQIDYSLELIQKLSDCEQYDDTNEIFENNMLYFASKYFYENYTKTSLLIEFVLSSISFILFVMHLTFF
jgi:hypothetical protein